MKIFVINLERSIERRQRVEKSLQALNLDYEIFPAVDGGKLTDEDWAQVKTEDEMILELVGGRKVKVMDKLSNGEIGCALSHLRVYQRILDLGLDKACIIEDDTSFNPIFLEAINSIDFIKEPWDIVNFTHHRGIKSWGFAKKYYFGSTPELRKQQYFQRVGLWNPTLDAIFNPRRFLSMCACYVVTNHTCEELIKIGYPVRLAADYLAGMLAYNHLRLFKVFPDQDYYLSYNQGDSDINKYTEVRSHHKLVRM